MKKRFLILVAALMAMMVVTAPAFAVTKIVTGGSTGLQILGSALAAQYGKGRGSGHALPVGRRLDHEQEVGQSQTHVRTVPIRRHLLDPPAGLRPFSIEPSPWTVAGSGVSATERCRA